jgi:chromate reductase
MSATLRVLGISGSLRRASFNKGLIRAATEGAPDGMTIEAFELAGIPLYDADVEAEGLPDRVAELKTHIGEADGLLIATPEYNYSIPGVLKNAIDWASRPAGGSPLRSKPVAIVGASGGGFGTVRAQLALRQVFLSTGSLALPQPELRVTHARERFDAAGNLADEAIRAELGSLLVAFVTWIRCLQNRDR